MPLVKGQLAKLQKHLDKVEMMAMSCESNSSDLIHLKERYESFQL
jgi:hypothetical protein